jgi:hypothetical protein
MTRLTPGLATISLRKTLNLRSLLRVSRTLRTQLSSRKPGRRRSSSTTWSVRAKSQSWSSRPPLKIKKRLFRTTPRRMRLLTRTAGIKMETAMMHELLH